MFREYGRRVRSLIRPGQHTTPWMRYRELEVLEELLTNLAPGRCLEWGSGYSTLHFPNLLSADTTWLSIEHNRDWHTEIAGRLTRDRVELICVPPNREPWTDDNNDGAYDDLADYIEAVAERGPFDFILVDGRARVACLEKAFELVTDAGVVCLHDANRTYYHEPFARFAEQMFFGDYRKGEGGLWFGSKGTNLTTLVREDHHRALWRAASKVGALLRI